MGTHKIRQEKWETIRRNIERSTELLNEVQELTEELREDYSYSGLASERREKLQELYSEIEQALKILGNAEEILDFN